MKQQVGQWGWSRRSKAGQEEHEVTEEGVLTGQRKGSNWLLAARRGVVEESGTEARNSVWRWQQDPGQRVMVLHHVVTAEEGRGLRRERRGRWQNLLVNWVC